MPTLWGRASSVNVQKPMWLLAELGIVHERIDAGWTYGGTDTDAFRRMNPTGLVPVWQEDDAFSVAESNAILRYLARDAEAWWPAEPRARARVDQWMEFASTTLLPALAKVFYAKIRLDPATTSDAQMHEYLAALDKALDILEGRLSQSACLAADHLTLADISAGTQMFRVYDLDIPRRARPALDRWYAAMSSRPGYQSSAMTSYDELRFQPQ